MSIFGWGKKSPERPAPTPPQERPVIIAPEAPNQTIHEIAFDIPGRAHLWRPPHGHVFSVEIRAPQIDESVFASFDRAMIAQVLRVANHLLDGDVRFLFSDEPGAPAPNLFFELYENIPGMGDFRGGVCYPGVTAQNELLSARLAWTAWKHGYHLHPGSALHEIGHSFGFGHTDSREGCIVMGSCPNGWDYAPVEYDAWRKYMKDLDPGVRNPRAYLRGAGTPRAMGAPITCPIHLLKD
jgi:hypothetical protein